VSLSIARADERERAIAARDAAWAIERVFGRDAHQDLLLRLADVSSSDARHYTRDRLKALVKQRVGPLGPLLLLNDSGGTAASASEASSSETVPPERRLAETVMAQRSSIVYSGHDYRLVAASGGTGQRDTGEFQVVRLPEARKVMEGLIKSPSLGSAEQKAAAKEAIEMLVDDRAPAGSSGIFLLRRSSQTYFYPEVSSEPATTPSAMRAAAGRQREPADDVVGRVDTADRAGPGDLLRN
jgi:hypothetical protein